jgi:hypothetical protein
LPSGNSSVSRQAVAAQQAFADSEPRWLTSREKSGLGIAQSALGELDKDFKFAESLDGDALQCPLCGTEHHNSFANRFSLGDDRQQCRILIQTLQSELDEARSKTAALLREVEARNFRVAKINALLQTKRGKWRLHDLIDAEGQRRAFDLLAKELDASGEALGKLLFQLDGVKRRLKQLTDPKRKKEIDAYYSQEMIHLLARLNVQTLPPAEAERIRLTLHNTGSDQPRTVLAYYLAFLATMRKYGSTPSCPMIIDTPHQQDQDADNAKRIVECILESQPKDEQLILVAVSLHGAKHEGTEIHLTEPQRLLKPDQYENVGRVFAPYFDQMAHAGSG